MRNDLNKQLCEHERNNSADNFSNYRHLKKFNPSSSGDDENLSSHESMKIRFGYDRKSFGENLKPLYGAVHKAVGRKWNSFYSDLCKTFNMKSVINQHIVTHLDDYVEQNIFIKDGELFVRHNYMASEPLKGSSTQYYVDPRDGVLKKNKHYETNRTRRQHRDIKEAIEKNKIFRQLDDGSVLRFIDNVWYHFEMAKVPDGQIVYNKPLNKDVFKRNWHKKEKTWDELDIHEREFFGIKSIIGTPVRDLFTGQTMINDTSAKYFFGRFRHKPIPLPHAMYHAKKETASRKILKQAGIIK